MSADLLRYLAGFLAMETFESFALTCKEAAAATVAEHERRECIRQALGVVFAWASEEAMPELLKEPSGENDGHVFEVTEDGHMPFHFTDVLQVNYAGVSLKPPIFHRYLSIRMPTTH